MRRVKLLATSISFVLGLCAPALMGVNAFAVQLDGPSLACPTVEVTNSEVPTQFTNPNTESCDLSVNKQVSVNGGVFMDADTSGTAASAFVGDTVTWKITVTNNSSDLNPTGVVYVKDVLPAGVTYVSHVATDGTYAYNDGSFFQNNWILPSFKSIDDTLATTLPATLTITTTAAAAGLIQNTAAFNKYDPGTCDGGCVYQDADADNNSNDAWVNVRTKPQVLDASTTLTNTGSGTGASIAAGMLLAATLAIVGYGRLYRRPKHFKV